MIYLDNNATTRIDDAVLDAMLPFLKEEYGNASSLQHKLGRTAHQAIEKSRSSIANYFGASSKEIYFTSGATESINMVLRGIFERYQSIGKHIITTKSEHKAVLTTLEILTKKGAEITYLPLDNQGNINLSDLENSIRPETILVCLMQANNETGVIHPLAKIAEIISSKDVLLFSDTTQAIGKYAFDYAKSGIDICCFSAHKLHGPKGIGGLYIKRKTRPIQIEPLITGGKQENSLRGGTYNTPSIVGMGKAFELISLKYQEQTAELRNYFENRILQEIEDTAVHASHADRLCNTTNILFKHVKSAELMPKLINIAVSSGSACVSGDRDPSHVLTAMGIAAEDALCSLRFSLSKFITKEELDVAIEDIKSAVQKIRKDSPIWQLYKSGVL
ncbi:MULTISPECIES: cysteine desulfurase family protein [Sphingobacterium]|uniref:Cysteine desulfurase n=1 Tax=Sphingobacterium litopenaei TaxID=2763500 RepID=A0ABR7YE86_9SPHI|nr:MULTISPECIES: cysteine desulfurase family protein [Sphingobacterium]MBD1429629.1 cysteine desulfurase [Sphingobacterium litopenaei]NGM73031.1 cysteine desulfurase [Sphingobacterium sp. SGL-16]